MACYLPKNGTGVGVAGESITPAGYPFSDREGLTKEVAQQSTLPAATATAAAIPQPGMRMTHDHRPFVRGVFVRDPHERRDAQTAAIRCRGTRPDKIQHDLRTAIQVDRLHAVCGRLL